MEQSRLNFYRTALAVLVVALLMTGLQWRIDTNRIHRDLEATRREYYADHMRVDTKTLENDFLKAQNQRLADENATLKETLKHSGQTKTDTGRE